MPSLELRGKYWHLRYRLNGESRSESTRCFDKKDAAEYMKRRLQECPAMAPSWHPTRRTPGRNPGVYFLYSKSTGLTKIGQSRNVDSRIYDLAQMNPRDLELIAVVSTTAPSPMESRIHSELKDARQHGEWFQLNGLELARAIGRAMKIAHEIVHEARHE